MTNRQLEHLTRIRAHFSCRATQKFFKGAEEHGGDLQDKSVLELVDDALDECIDQFTYLMTLREKLDPNTAFSSTTESEITNVSESNKEADLDTE